MSTTEQQNPVKLAWHERAGDWAKKNQGDIALVIGFVLVALISFGIGYLSAPGAAKNSLTIENPQAAISETASGQGTTENTQNSSSAATSQSNAKGLIVASKSGTKYHWPWCTYAEKIKQENQVWFNSESEAQAAGYSKCSNFDKLAPAGYVAQ